MILRPPGDGVRSSGGEEAKTMAAINGMPGSTLCDSTNICDILSVSIL